MAAWAVAGGGCPGRFALAATTGWATSAKARVVTGSSGQRSPIVPSKNISSSSAAGTVWAIGVLVGSSTGRTSASGPGQPLRIIRSAAGTIRLT